MSQTKAQQITKPSFNTSSRTLTNTNNPDDTDTNNGWSSSSSNKIYSSSSSSSSSTSSTISGRPLAATSANINNTGENMNWSNSSFKSTNSSNLGEQGWPMKNNDSSNSQSFKNNNNNNQNKWNQNDALNNGPTNGMLNGQLNSINSNSNNQNDLINDSTWNPLFPSSNLIISNNNNNSATNSDSNHSKQYNNNNNTNNHHYNQNHQNGWGDNHQNNNNSQAEQTHLSNNNEWSSSTNNSSNNNSNTTTTTTARNNVNNNSNSSTIPPTAPTGGSTASTSTANPRSWAKIVSQQSSTNNATTPSSASAPTTTNNNNNIATVNNNNNNNATPSSSTSSSSSSNQSASNPNQTNSNSNNYHHHNHQQQQHNHHHHHHHMNGNPNQIKHNDSNHNLENMDNNKTKNNNDNMIIMNDMNDNANANINVQAHEWDIKVNQTVPWSVENDFSKKMSLNQQQPQVSSTVSNNNSSNNGSFNNMNFNINNNDMVVNGLQNTTNNQSSSSSSSSSISGENNMFKQQQFNSTSSANVTNNSHNQKMPSDTGTEIWLQPNNNSSNSKWGETNSNNPSQNLESSSSPISNQQNWSPNSLSRQTSSNMKWNESSASSNHPHKLPIQDVTNTQWLQQNNKSTNWMNQEVAPVSAATTTQAVQPTGWGSSNLPASKPAAAALLANPTVAAATLPLSSQIFLSNKPAAPIEPSGWDDPDFKVIKKSDDGTNIWGDPESHKQIKVQKWTNKNTPNAPVLGKNDDSESVDANNDQQSSTSSSASPSNSLANSMKNQSQWNNTPAAPASLSLLNDQSNNNNTNTNNDSDFHLSSEWSQGIVDTRSWGPATNKDAKNNFDPSVGVIDTSKWSSQSAGPGGPLASNGPNVVSPLNPSSATATGVMPHPNKLPGSANVTPAGVLPLPQSNNDWQLNPNLFNNNNRDDMMDMRSKQPLLNRTNSSNNATGLNSVQNQMLNTLNRMPSNNGNNNAPFMNAQLMQNIPQAKNNLQNLPNTSNNSNIMFPGQSPAIGANSNIHNMMQFNNMGLGGVGVGNSTSSSTNLASQQSNQQQPPIQQQLIDSFRMAVQAGLISPDLLNTKLPQDVLSHLYQLFQTLNQYVNANNKLANLTKKRPQLTSTQFKTELDILNQELTPLKEHLLILKNKINAAHMQLKQQGSMNKMNNSGSLSGTQTPVQVTTPTNGFGILANDPLATAAAAAGVQLSDLPVINPTEAQKSKLLQLLNDQPTNQLNRQPSKPNTATTPNSLFQSFSSSSSSSSSNQWSNFNNNNNNPSPSFLDQVDDRITPFVPGQLWTGHSQSLEDDPNCTPGSVSKPLLTETIDPESILSGLHRGSNQWSNTLGNFDFTQSLNGPTSMNGGMNNRGPARIGAERNNNNNNNNSNNSWPSNNSFNSQLSMPNQSSTSTIGEQLWGVRSASRVGNQPTPSGNNTSMNNNNNNNNQMNRNSASFSNNNNNNLILNQQQQQQQQFLRSNSWNVAAPGGNHQQSSQQQLSNSQDSRNNNFNQQNQNNPLLSNGGHFILLRNVTSQIDQMTLKALCGQHASGQLTYYRYIPQMQCVIVRYNSKEEANSALTKLNSISLSNTTIFTQALTENELKFLFM